MGKKTLLLGLVLGASFAFATPQHPSPPVVTTSKRVVVSPEIRPSLEILNRKVYCRYYGDSCVRRIVYEDVRIVGRPTVIKGYDVKCKRRWYGARKCRAVERYLTVVVPMLDAVRWTATEPGVILSR